VSKATSIDAVPDSEDLYRAAKRTITVGKGKLQHINARAQIDIGMQQTQESEQHPEQIPIDVLPALRTGRV
jgi:hypothetical protein